IASGSWDATTQVWNASAGSWLLTYPGHSQRVWSVAWSPDDTKIVSGSHDGTAQIWSSSTAGRIYTYTGHGSGNTVWQALWSPNGQMIASAGYDGTAQVRQAEEDKVLCSEFCACRRGIYVGNSGRIGDSSLHQPAVPARQNLGKDRRPGQEAENHTGQAA